MKKILLTILITSVVLAGATAGFLIWAYQAKNGLTAEEESNRKEVLDEGDTHAIGLYTKTEAKELITEGNDKNVLSFQTQSNVYDVKHSTSARDRLDRLIKRTSPTVETPLIAYNPFGVNENTFYFYFTTNKNCYIKYSVVSENGEIPDFTRKVYNGASANLSKVHEFTVGGIVPGKKNYIIMKAIDGDGTQIFKQEYVYQAKATPTGIREKIDVARGRSEQTSSEGLYYVFPKEKPYILAYDNSGYLRLVTKTYSSVGKKLVIQDSELFYAVRKNQIAKLTQTGQVVGVYTLTGYDSHLDFDYDGYGNLYVIAKKKGKTDFIRVNMNNGSIQKVISLDKKVKLSSLELGEGGVAYLSSSSPSGILKLRNIASDLAKASYVLGAKKDWKKTRYQKGTFSMKDKQAFPKRIERLFLHKNMISVVGNSGNNTSYYRFEVDGKKKKFKVNKKIHIPYTSTGGSGQDYDGSYILASGSAGCYGEYDEAGKNLKSFQVGFPIRSAEKYTLRSTCFY